MKPVKTNLILFIYRLHSSCMLWLQTILLKMTAILIVASKIIHLCKKKKKLVTLFVGDLIIYLF